MKLRVPYISIAVGFGTMAMAMNSSAMSATVPLMIRENHLSIAAAQWVISIYTLTLSGCLITSGRIGDAVGLRNVYLCGLLVVIASSVLLLVSDSMGLLLSLRAVEGVGAAMISGTSLALLADECSECDYGRSVGWQTGITYSGLIAGPILSMTLAARFGWRAIFVINVLVCSAAYVIGCKLLRLRPRARVCLSELRTSPLVGPIVFFISIILVIISIQGRSIIPMHAVRAAILVVSASVVILFCSAGWRTTLVPAPNGSWGFVISELLCYVTAFGIAFVAPVYLIGWLHCDPSIAGWILSCQHVARAAAAVLGIGLVPRIGPINVRVLGTTIIAIATLTLAILKCTSDALVALALGAIGVGTGLFVPANTAEFLASASLGERGAMTGVLATARNLGMTMGVVLGGLSYRAKIATIRSEEDSFHAAMLVLAAVATANVLAVAQTRREQLFRATSH